MILLIPLLLLVVVAGSKEIEYVASDRNDLLLLTVTIVGVPLASSVLSIEEDDDIILLSFEEFTIA
jgi:hypothetical protein